MSEEYTHVGTVRRRPRPGYQRSQSSSANGEAKSNGNGSHTRNGRDSRHDFERDSYFDKGFDETSREARDSRRSRPRPEAEPRAKQSKERPRKSASQFGPELEEEPLFKFPFDPWRLYGAAKRNFGWILCAGALMALAGFFFAAYMVDYKIPVQLIRKTSNAVRSDNMMALDFMPREYSEQTLFSFMTAYPVRQRVAEKAKADPLLAPLKVTPEKLAGSISVKPTPNPDIVVMNMEAFGGLRSMVDL